MITVYTFEEIKNLENISDALKKELLKYFKEIAEGIVGEEWEEYNLREVGSIVVLEDTDTVDALDEFGLMQGNKSIPHSLPEFALRVKVGEVEMYKIIWVVSDSFGVAVYYPKGKFGKEFEEWLKEYLID
jgi:hypothetical protein